jgi:hypothetical protein
MFIVADNKFSPRKGEMSSCKKSPRTRSRPIAFGLSRRHVCTNDQLLRNFLCKLLFLFSGDSLLQRRAQLQNARYAIHTTFCIGLVHQLRDHMPNFFAALNKFGIRAAFRFQAMKPIAEIIGQREHLLKRARQRRQVLQAVTSGAELRPAERFRRCADAVHAVAFDTIEPRHIRPNREVTAGLKELQRLPVTVSAHLKSRARIRSGDEASVSLELFRLRSVPAVAVLATDIHLGVCARLINGNNLACSLLLTAMAGDAFVVALRSDWVFDADDRPAGQAQP